MLGQVSIYKGYMEGNTPSVGDAHIYQESNLIVDGFKEHIVDMLTRVPYVSGNASSVSSTYDTSNFGIQAITLSPNETAFPRIHSLAALSGWVASSDSGLSPPYNTGLSFRCLDTSDGKAWSYNTDINNHLFSGVNYPSALNPVRNSKVDNASFSGLTSHLQNGRFRDYSLDPVLSGIYMNEVLSLYELRSWDIQSWLRYEPSALEYIDAYRAGSCARHDMSSVSSIYSALSGTAASSTYAEADDGILFVRSFKSNVSTEGSGLVSLSQRFKVNTTDIAEAARVSPTDNVLAEITAQFSVVSGGTNSTVRVLVEDETDGQAYFFSGTGSNGRHSWGYGGERLVVAAVSSTSGTISQFIQIPTEKADHTFRVTYQFYCHDGSDVLKTYFWNANVNHINGWYLGNIFSGSDMHRVYANEFKSPAMYIGCSSIGATSPSALQLSSISYITQAFNMDPIKKYSVNPFFGGTEALSAGADALQVAVVKKTSSNVAQKGMYNYLSEISCSSFMETKLVAPQYCISPEYPRTSTPETLNWMGKTYKPSDLCLELGAGSSLSGTVILPLNNPATVQVEALQTFKSGLSAVGADLTLRTANKDGAGEYRFFNFGNATWDISGVPSTSGDIVYNLSSLGGFGFSKFTSREINVNQLINVVDEASAGGFELVLQASNAGSNPAFLKGFRINADAPSEHIEEIWRINDMHTVDFDGNQQWRVLDNSGQYLFSGVINGVWQDVNVVPPVTNLLATYPIENMYAASGSNHSSDSRYQVYIMNCKVVEDAAGDASTEAFKLNLVTLGDNALITCTEDAPEDVFTSESYTRTLSMDITNQPLFQWVDTSTVYHEGDAYNRVHPGVSLVSPPGRMAVSVYNFWSLSSGISFVTFAEAPTDAPVPQELSLLYNFNLKDISLPLSSTKMAFSVAFNQPDIDSGFIGEGTEPDVKWQAAATTKTGEVVWWDSATSAWEQKDMSAIPKNGFSPGFTFNRGGLFAAGVTNPKVVLSEKFDITNKDFDDTTKIQVRLVTLDYDQYDLMTVTQWKFYTINELPPRDLGVFPAPNQTTVQPPVSPQGELGHFTNQIQYQPVLSAVDLDRACGNANYAVSSGLTVSGVNMGSWLNTFGVLNSDGYILFGRAGPIGGLASYVSGFYSSATTSSMVYTIDVSSNDMRYLDVQGGVGAIGLHTFNINKTYQKLKDNGYSLSSIYDYNASTGVYTLNDTTRNPVFRLVSKKVFRTPIDIDTLANSFTRIQWELRFI